MQQILYACGTIAMGFLFYYVIGYKAIQIINMIGIYVRFS